MTRCWWLLGLASSISSQLHCISSQLHCFPFCDPAQCNGLYGPRFGPQERWKEVARWVKKKAPTAFIDDRIVMAPGRFGAVTATADEIHKGEIILRLPAKSFLLEEDCFPSPEFTNLGSEYVPSLEKLPRNVRNESNSRTPDFTMAALCLMIHQLLGEESPYWPYLKHLPPQGSAETYMFRDPSEFNPFRGTDSYRVVSITHDRHQASIRKAAAFALPAIQQYLQAELTLENFKDLFQRALSLCGSRTFNLDSDMLAPGNGHPTFYRPALVPLLDMLNHGDGRQRNCLYFFNITGKYFQLQAIRDIEPGEELIHSYGTRSNSELLFFYGFTIPDSTDDFVSVADLTQGALKFNFHKRMGHPLRCHLPYFRAVEGGGWPPSFQTVLKGASPDDKPSNLRLGPLSPSVYKAFWTKLQTASQGVTDEMRALAINPGAAMLRVVGGAYVVDTHKPAAEPTLGDLTVDLLWEGSQSQCIATDKPRCEDHAPGAASVGHVLQQLHLGRIPGVVQAGGCLVWSESKQQMFEVRKGLDGFWAAFASEGKTGAPKAPATPAVPSAEEEQLRLEFHLKRVIIRAANLEEFATRVFRNGLVMDTLKTLRIAVLHPLSSFAIHGILSDRHLPMFFETQVANTLAVFCFEELTRRLQALGEDPDSSGLELLLWQARRVAMAESCGNYEAAAKGELAIVHEFCSGVPMQGLWD